MYFRISSKECGGRQQLSLIGRVDAVEIRMRDRRTGHPHMHLTGTCVIHHLNNLHRRGAAHDAVVHQDDALALDRHAIGAVLQPHAQCA